MSEPSTPGQKIALGSVVALGGAAVLGSYVAAVGNVGNHFTPVPGEATSKSYLDSPFWLGVPTSTTRAVTGAQILAAGGFLALVSSRLFDGSVRSPTTGLLRWLPSFTLVVALLIAASTAWPYLARRALHSPSASSVAACVVSLVLAALAVILLVADTFESDTAPWYATLGALLLGLVVVLADGVGWSARLITLYLDGTLQRQVDKEGGVIRKEK